MRFMQNTLGIAGFVVAGSLFFTGCNDSGDPPVTPGDELFQPTAEDKYNVRRCPELADNEQLRMGTGFLTQESANLWNLKYDKSYGYDTLADVGDLQTITGRFWRSKSQIPSNGKGAAGETVHVFAEIAGVWTAIATTKTLEDGYYEVDLSADDAFALGSHRILSILEASGTCVEHGVFVWPKGTQVLVSDIDATLTTDDNEMITQMFNDLEKVPPMMPSADLMIQAWHGKGYGLNYLTARPHDFRSWTRIWLREEGFPLGVVETADSLVVGESAATYKGAFVRRLQDLLEWDIVVAYGNAFSDVEGYDIGEIPKDVQFMVNEAAEDGGYLGSTPVPGNDYGPHITSYIDVQPDATKPAPR